LTRRKLLITGAAAAILGGVVTGFVLAWGSAGEGSAAKPALPPATADVTRTTLVEMKTMAGALGYGDPVPLSAAGSGTLTWIAPVGSTVKRGGPLFNVDERPVVALYGSLPLYRPLGVGTKGRDVRQLERNLAALGRTGFTVDNTYTTATATAIGSWQATVGLPAAGTIERGQVVFTPGPVRIAGHVARVGATIGGESAEGGAPVLTYTGTTRVVTVELEAADRPLAAKGRTVTVRIPDVRALRGRISQVGTVLTAEGAPADEGAAPAAADAVVEVTVTIANQKALGSLDAAPVDVDFVSDRREGVLAAPVVALLALPEGGFGVEVVEGSTTRIVPVRTGMFAGGLVEITGEGIAEGVKVGVPQ
jgi:hypothetical protein